MLRSRRRILVPLLAAASIVAGLLAMWVAARISPRPGVTRAAFILERSGESVTLRPVASMPEMLEPSWSSALEVRRVIDETSTFEDVVSVRIRTSELVGPGFIPSERASEAVLRRSRMIRDAAYLDDAYEEIVGEAWRAVVDDAPLPEGWQLRTRGLLSTGGASVVVAGPLHGTPSVRMRRKASVRTIGRVLFVGGAAAGAVWLFARFVVWVDDGSVAGRWRRGVCIRCEYPLGTRGRCPECGAFQRRPPPSA